MVISDESLFTESFVSQQPTIDEELLRGVKRQLESFLEYHVRPTPIESPASLGARTLETLRWHSLMSELPSIGGQPSVLSQSQIQDLALLEQKHHVVAFLTPVFEKILPPSYQVVNSEEYAWLQTTSTARKYNQNPDNICLATNNLDREKVQSQSRQYLLSRRHV